MNQLQVKPISDTWIPATWNEYLQVLNDPNDENLKSYYHQGQMRFEMSPLGNPHSRDHFMIIAALSLFASLKNIDLDGHDNCAYYKAGCEAAQPDISFYVDQNAEVIPWAATLIDLDHYPAPDLVIEIAHASLSDDKGEKRLLYEALGVREYWIVDVKNVQIIAFAIQNQGSYRIERSQVLPGLEMTLLEEVCRRSRQMNHGKVTAWLLSQWQDQKLPSS